jgi:hypothetical protein
MRPTSSKQSCESIPKPSHQHLKPLLTDEGIELREAAEGEQDSQGDTETLRWREPAHAAHVGPCAAPPPGNKEISLASSRHF